MLHYPWITVNPFAGTSPRVMIYVLEGFIPMANMIPMSEISRGIVLEIDGALWTVLEYQGFKAGKGNSEARMRMKIRDVRTGQTQEKVYRTDDKVAKALVETRDGQYTYNDGDLYHFTDMETYDEKMVSEKVLGDTAKFLTDGLEVQLLIYRDEVLSVQLPITVDLTIAHTEPGFKGDTASAANKKATTDTGLVIDVPMFLNIGDTVRIDTRNNSYITRV